MPHCSLPLTQTEVITRLLNQLLNHFTTFFKIGLIESHAKGFPPLSVRKFTQTRFLDLLRGMCIEWNLEVYDYEFLAGIECHKIPHSPWSG